MISAADRPHVDPNNRIEREINGCKVRLFFSLSRNEKVERQVLDNLMLVFDKKMQGMVNVQA